MYGVAMRAGCPRWDNFTGRSGTGAVSADTPYQRWRSAARRILNLDQAQVVAMDGDDVVLDERLLHVQFQLKDEHDRPAHAVCYS